MISRVLNGAALHSGPVSAIDDDVRSTSYTAQPPETDPDTSRDCTDSDAEERAIYASWLETKWKHFVPRPCNHLLSNRVLDLLETKVPAHLQEDPLSPFRTESDRIDVATTNLCLRLYVVRSVEQAGGREGLRSRLKETQAGTRALSWFIGSGYHMHAESAVMGLIAATAFCMVGQGSTSLWWELLMLKHVPKYSGKTSAPSHTVDWLMSHEWRNMLLRSLIEAEAYWSTGNTFNGPLESFFTAKRNREWPCTSGSHKWLVGNMTFADKTGIDLEKYDEFTANVSIHVTARAELDKGSLELMHPVHPSPNTLLSCFNGAAHDQQKQEVLDDMSYNRLRLLSIKFVQHLHHAGKTAHARAVVRRAWKALKKKRGSAVRTNDGFLKRKATRHEVRLGIPVDEREYIRRHPLFTQRDWQSLYGFACDDRR